MVSILQLIPLPLPLLRILSSHTARIYEVTRGLDLGGLSASNFYPLSFSISLSLYDLAKYACFGLFGHLVYRYVTTKKRIEILVEIILIAAFCQAFYGLAEYFSGSGRYSDGKIFTIPDRHSEHSSIETTFPAF